MARRQRSAEARRRRRSRSRPRRRGGRDSGDDRSDDAATSSEEGGEVAAPYRVEVCRARRGPAEPMFDIQVDDAGQERVVPHICARLGEGYVIRVTNSSKRHIACAVTVDGENALLREGSLIVAPRDSRELPGFLVSKNFVGKEYVKEYRDFRFGKPKVIEADPSKGPAAQDQTYTTYGQIRCEVYEAVLDEEVDSDQELRGQTTFYRGAGLHGSFEDRLVPEGKKKHFIYSSVTVQGPHSRIANSTRGRWWVRGSNLISTLEVRYREAHSLLLLGVDAQALGLARCKTEDGGSGRTKKEKLEEKEEEKDELEKLLKCGGPGPGLIEVCDLTAADDGSDAEVSGGDGGGGGGVWSVAEAPRQAEPVDV